ncbi:MAG: pantoate--beta-alanine ligase [Nitrospinota bacterium]
MSGKKRKTEIIRAIKGIGGIENWALSPPRKGGTCGLVPTLGALHEGHLALIRTARRENDRVVVSVFVNPPQFRKKQFRDYPRDLKGDIEKASSAGADAVFAPKDDDMYPPGFDARIVLPSFFSELKSQKFEWHYRAVLTVVMKLFMLVRPHNAYFGQKDPHQLVLIEKMVNDFNVPVKIRQCPTVREKSGLARSSRNALLTDGEKKAATVIYKALKAGRAEILKKGAGHAPKAVAMTKKMISSQPLARIEHVEIVDAQTLKPLSKNSRRALIFAAVWIGGKRLTDNIRFNLS